MGRILSLSHSPVCSLLSGLEFTFFEYNSWKFPDTKSQNLKVLEPSPHMWRVLSNIWLCCTQFSDHCWPQGWFSEGPSHLRLSRDPPPCPVCPAHCNKVRTLAAGSVVLQGPRASCVSGGRCSGPFTCPLGSKHWPVMIPRPMSPPPLGAVSSKCNFLSSLGHRRGGRPLLNLL